MAKTTSKKQTSGKSKESSKNAESTNKIIKEQPEIIHTEVISDSSHRSHQEIDDSADLSIRQKLVSLYTLQRIDTRIDRLRIVRGELPYEVQDLEDEVAGLQTRIDNYKIDVEKINQDINENKIFIKNCNQLIEKYKAQLDNVKNSREFDSLNKEIEFQILEIAHAEKRINDAGKNLEIKKFQLDEVEHALEERIKDLDEKRAELGDIIADTEADEENLLQQRESLLEKIEERLFFSYKRLRKNAKNGLAVVTIERDACGGCFNQIPPQRQMEIKQHKKIIVCEYCGRIIIDEFIQKEVEQQ